MKELMKSSDTMTLKEITDLLDVRHNDAMRIVEKMQQDQSFGASTKISYKLLRNNAEFTIQTYQLDKRQSIAVASKLNTALLMKVIDRWQELENAAPKLPETFSQALRLAADTQEALELEQLQHQKTQLSLTMANVRQISEVHTSLECLVVDITNQHPEIDIRYRPLLALLREHKMIRRYGSLPLKRQNKSLPFTLKSGGDNKGNRITYLPSSDRESFLIWYCAITNQIIQQNA